MISHAIQQQLQTIIRGAGIEEPTDHCAAIRNLLCRSFETSATSKRDFESKRIIKEGQDRFLRAYAKKNDLLASVIPPGCQYLTRGGEALIYFTPGGKNVIKINDGRYYATWTEYFNSILIHNILFPGTAYRFAGFIEQEGSLCAVLQQPYIRGEQIDLNDVKAQLTYYGFENIKRQDYFHKEFNLLLEDMHDENVIGSNGVLFFIDTVFYILES